MCASNGCGEPDDNSFLLGLSNHYQYFMTWPARSSSRASLARWQEELQFVAAYSATRFMNIGRGSFMTHEVTCYYEGRKGSNDWSSTSKHFVWLWPSVATQATCLTDSLPLYVEDEFRDNETHISQHNFYITTTTSSI